jgi:hypothetical protein
MVAPKTGLPAKRKTYQRANTWKPGQSGNPKGRPAEGQSWAAVIREVTNLTPEEINSLIQPTTDLGRAFSQMPRAVQLKYLMILRAVSAIMFDPQAAMLNVFMDREDGKVADKLNLTGELNFEGLDKVLEKAYGKPKSG